MADANLTAIRYIAESTWGTTPAAALKALRYTGESLVDTKGTIESAEIISTRDLRDVRQVARSSSGSINLEMSYGTLDDMLEGALCSTWATNAISNGVVKKSFTFEKQFTDLTNEFIAFKGVRVNTLSLNMALGQIVTGSVGLLGKKGVSAASTVGTGAPASGNSNVPLSVTQLGVAVGGVAASGVTEVTLEMNNNLRVLSQFGDVDPYGIGLGSFRLNGSVSRYFTGRAGSYTVYENHASEDLVITMTDDDGNIIEFDIPALRWLTAEPVAGGLNGDVLLRMNFSAIIDPVGGKMVTITRTPAA